MSNLSQRYFGRDLTNLIATTDIRLQKKKKPTVSTFSNTVAHKESISTLGEEKRPAKITPTLQQKVAEFDRLVRSVPSNPGLHELFWYLKEQETRSNSLGRYMPLQPELTDSLRTGLVDWMVCFNEHLGLSSAVLHLAVNILDRFLGAETLHKHELPIVGIACIILAAKFEQHLFLSARVYNEITRFGYDRVDVVGTEARILSALKYSLAAATEPDFVMVYSCLQEAGSTCLLLVSYFTELLLRKYKALRFLPSCRAAAAFHVARIALRLPDRFEWMMGMEQGKKEVAECVAEIVKELRLAAGEKDNPVVMKYCDKKYRTVALIEIDSRIL